MTRYRFDSIDKMPFRAPDAWPADLPIPGILPAYSIVRAYGRYFGTIVTDTAPGQLVEVAIDGVIAELISPMEAQPLGNERPLIREKGGMPKARAFEICEDLELIVLDPEGDIDVPGVVLEADEDRGTYTWMIVSGGFGPPIDSAIAGKADKAYVDARDDELEEAIASKLDASALDPLEADIASRQPHSAGLDELSGLDPSEVGKSVLTAADKAAARLAIGAQDAATALQYRVGQTVEFAANNPPSIADGFLPKDGITVYNKADNPRYQALVDALGLGAFLDIGNVVKKDDSTSPYTQPSKLAPLAYIGGKWIFYPTVNNGNQIVRYSPDLQVWTTQAGVNISTFIGNSQFANWGAVFNGRVHLIGGSAPSLGYTSSADGLTGFTASVNLSTLFNVGGAGGTPSYLYLNGARTLDNRLWIFGSSSGTALTSPSFIAYLDQAGNWTRCNTAGINRPIFDMARKPNGTIIAVTYNGEIYASDDEGATWQGYNSGVVEHLQACAWDAAHGTFVIGGAGGRLVTTTTGKSNFTKGLISSAITTVNDIMVVNGLVIVACTGSGLDGRGRLHISRDLLDWSYKLVNNSEAITQVYRIAYNAGRYAFLANSTYSLLANGAPAYDPNLQFYVPKDDPSTPGTVKYVKF